MLLTSTSSPSSFPLCVLWTSAALWAAADMAGRHEHADQVTISRDGQVVANVHTPRLDLARPGRLAPRAADEIDTIVCLNVVDHLEEDEAVLRQYRDLLVPGGHLVVHVPAHEWLFGECDRSLGHCRRHSASGLRDKLGRAGFEVVRVRQFNRLGVLGWRLSK